MPDNNSPGDYEGYKGADAPIDGLCEWKVVPPDDRSQSKYERLPFWLYGGPTKR